jgi:hypothetical protein
MTEIPRGDAPPMRDRTGLIAKTGIMSGLPGHARAVADSRSRIETTRKETVTAGRKPLRLSRRAPGRQGARRKRYSVLMNALMTVMLVYALLPLFWLVVNASKTQRALFTTFGLWFGGRFALW